MNVLNTVNLFSLYKTNNTVINPKKDISRLAFKAELNADCFEPQEIRSQKTKYGTIHYLKNKKFSNLEFEKPLSLIEAFHTVSDCHEDFNLMNYGLLTHGCDFARLGEAFSIRFKDMKFTKFLGAGNNAIAFECEDGKVLKLCEHNHFTFRDKSEEFDAKIYLKKNIKNYYFYYLQEKCSQEGISEKHVDEMTKRIEKLGYEVFDMSESQLGFGKDGKLYLLDPECARNTEKFEEVKKENEFWLFQFGIGFDYM